jgi:protein gp37
MSDQRKDGISWTDTTWGPIRGCSKVSAGCAHCYAESMAARFCGEGMPYHGLIRNGHWSGDVRFVADKLDQPLRWKRPRRIFVNSMSDLFHESLANEQIAAVFGVMAACPQHTFQVLTKRAKRMAEWFAWLESHPYWSHPLQDALCEHPGPLPGLDADDEGATLAREVGGRNWPLPNVHIGVSCENQQTADERIPLLLQCPAAVRWVSAEPLLGQIEINGALGLWNGKPSDGYCGGCRVHGDFNHSGICERRKLDWVVVGGESGPHARPMHPDWARSIRDQCKAAGTPFHFKQLGDVFQKSTTERRIRLNDIPVREWRACKKRAGHLLDGHEYRMYPGDKWP